MAVRIRRAFTLVELLVVIGIVALLIALLMPALNRARSHAQRIQCASNLHTIGQALMMYTQQTGHYPGCIAPQGGGAIWAPRLRMFMGGDSRPFLCPSRDERFVWDPTLPPRVDFVDADGTTVRWLTDESGWYGYGPNERMVHPWGQHFSYGYNAWGTNSRKTHWNSTSGIHSFWSLGLIVYIGPGYDRELRAFRVRVASEMIAIGDSKGDGILDVTINTHASGLDWPGDVHDRGANILFCDGHVEWYAQRTLVNHSVDNPRTHQIRKLWNNDNLP